MSHVADYTRRNTYSKIAVEQCADVDPVSGHQCLLSNGHDRMRGTRHRSVHIGQPFRWGAGVETAPFA
jgi:hypothetical protein